MRTTPLFRRTAAAVAVTAAALTTLAVGPVATATAAPASPWAGCPDGAVCVYPQNQTPAVKPSAVYYSYGAHNLQGQYGNHWVLNNQTGGAHAKLCDGANGTGNCHDDMPAQRGVYANLTPVNSIVLVRP